MNKDYKDGIQCSQFEALLADALDNVLTGATKTAFDAHGKTCPVCGPMLMEAREGLLWLETLEELDPPRNLVHNILAATSNLEVPSGAKPVAVPVKKARFRPVMVGFFRSRFVTSFCMAFFSLSLTLTVAGVRVSDLASIDWHPSALRKSLVLQYTHVESSVLKYYENMRLYNEVQSGFRALRKATATDDAREKNNKDDKQEKPKRKDSGPNDTSGRPEQHPVYTLNGESGGQLAYSIPKHEGVQL